MKNMNRDLIINYCICFYALCVPISKAGTSLFLGLLILLWIFNKNFFSEFKNLKKSNFLITLCLLFVISSLSVFWSDNITFVLNYLKKYGHFLVIPIIFLYLKKEYIKYVFNAFLLGMFISEIMSYGIYFHWWTYNGVPSYNPAPFMNHINYSVYLTLTIFILFHKVIFTNELKWKIIYTIYMLFVMSNLFINGGRTGQVAFFICLIIVGIINFKSKVKATISMILLGSVIFISAYSISPVFKSRINHLERDLIQVYKSNNYNGSMGQRFALWTIGTHAFLDNFLMGTGIGDEYSGAKKYATEFNFNIHRFRSDTNKGYIDYHNTFIQYAVQLGILGLLLFILLFYFLFKLPFKSKIYRNLNITFISLMILLSMVEMSTHIRAPMTLFILFSALFLSISKIETETKKPLPF